VEAAEEAREREVPQVVLAVLASSSSMNIAERR
jgi:hypothetical protein